jgi:hypothetical protein
MRLRAGSAAAALFAATAVVAAGQAAAQGSAPAAPATFKFGYLETPSGNIQCDYGYGGSSAAYLRCGVRSGLRPPEPRPPGGCGVDSGYAGRRVFMRATGPARPEPCEGDAGPFTERGVARVLAYGTNWSRAGFRCSSAFTGLTCRNRSGHGFFLSRGSWQLL